MAGPSASIAIADDDEMVRESLVALMEAYGFRVQAFASGNALLEGQASAPVDCILVDFHMPQVTGLDVLKALRDGGDATPVILFTGLPDRGLGERARELGAYAVLYKPLAPGELLVALHGALAAGKR